MLLSNDELFRAELEDLELDSPEMLPSTIEEIRVATKGDPKLSVLCEFSPHVRESKAALDSGFHALDSGFQNWILEFVSGTWILDSNLYWNSGLQSPGFPLPPEKFFWIPVSSSKNLPDSGIAESLTWGKNSWLRDGRLTNPVFQQRSAGITRGEMS